MPKPLFQILSQLEDALVHTPKYKNGEVEGMERRYVDELTEEIPETLFEIRQNLGELEALIYEYKFHTAYENFTE